MVYDDLGRLVEVIDPIIETPADGTVTYTHSETGAVLYSYTYDDNGSRIEKRDSANNLIQGYAWDQKRRIESVQQGSGAVDML